MKKSNPLSISQLVSIVRNYKKFNDDLQQEFMSIPHTEANESFKTALLLENRKKNRYCDVLANEDSRVKLKPICTLNGKCSESDETKDSNASNDQVNVGDSTTPATNSVNGASSDQINMDLNDGANEPDSSTNENHSDETSDYVNANWIDCSKLFGVPVTYIAAQGPLPQTVGDFWKMIYAYNVGVVLMLTKTKENGREKCHPYWPAKGSSIVISDKTNAATLKTNDKFIEKNEVIVKTVDEKEPISGIHVKKMEIHSYGTNKAQQMYLIQYLVWPDHGIPNETESYRRLIKISNDLHKEIEVSGGKSNQVVRPIVVHCSAGIGRTGTFCTIDIILKQLDIAISQNNLKNFKIDVLGIVSSLRRQRKGMVQMSSQYKFIYKVLEEEILSRKLKI